MKKIAIFLLVLLAVCILTVILLKTSPFGLCFDLSSGKVPDEAFEIYISKMIVDIQDDNFSWLEKVSTEESLQTIKEHRENFPFIDYNYSLEKIDDLGGLYDYRINFKDGSIVVSIQGHWPECPDNNITESEVTENLLLIRIR